MKKKIINFIIIALAVVLFVIVLNVLSFVNLFNKELKSETLYPEARAYMACAERVNEIYIFPLSHATHWEHPITKPFYAIRDKLYNKGLSLFPKNEGEKEIWWYKIRYVEYRELVEDNLVKYQINKDYAIPKFVYSKINRFHDWDNELYSHIMPIANAKITDKKYSKFKLDMFVQLSRLYVSMDSLSVIGSGWPKISWVSDKEVEKYDKIYQTYLNLLDYSKKYEKDSFDYFYNNMDRRIWGWFLAHEISENIINSRFANNKLTCEDKYLKLYADNRKVMNDYYNKNASSLSSGVKVRMSMDSEEVIPVLANKFGHCKTFKGCAEDMLKQLSKYNY